MASLKRIEPELEKDENIVLEADSRFAFPVDIMHEILLRLPVVSLLRFNIVCKHWRALISDPQFVKSHLEQANKGYNVNCLHMGPLRSIFSKCLVFPDNRPSFVTVTSINSGQTEITRRDIDCPSEFLTRNEELVLVLGSCNGLLLLRGLKDTTYLWNPSTRQCKSFTRSNLNRFFKYKDVCISGLGYDMSRDEYKGVAIKDRIVIVFSSKNGKWKKLEWDIAYRLFSSWRPPMSITVNGAPHWIPVGRFVSRSIMYFDVVDEQLKMFSLPTALNNNPFIVSLSLLEGCLCVLAYDQHPSPLCNIWVMKEYGVENSWTKLFAIHSPTFDFFVPLGYLKKGHERELVLQHESNENYVSYNVKTREKTSIDPIEKDFYQFSNMEKILYVETLISP